MSGATPTWRIDEAHWDAGRVWHQDAQYEGYAYTCGGCGFRSPDHNDVTRHIANAIRDSMAEWLKRLDSRPGFGRIGRIRGIK